MKKWILLLLLIPSTAWSDVSISNPPTGISNPVVGGTSGSIPFVDSNGLLNQDTTYLTWDQTNHQHNSSVADGGSAQKAFHFNSTNTLGTAGVRLFQVDNNATEIFSVTRKIADSNDHWDLYMPYAWNEITSAGRLDFFAGGSAANNQIFFHGSQTFFPSALAVLRNGDAASVATQVNSWPLGQQVGLWGATQYFRYCYWRMNVSTTQAGIWRESLYLNGTTSSMSDGTEFLTITSSGNLGIQNNAPTTLFQMSSGTLTVDGTGGMIQVDNGTSGSTTNSLVLGNPFTNTNTGTRLNFNLSTNLASFLGWFEAVRSNSPSNGGTYLDWATHNGTAVAERMRLSEVGNLGLGTSAPQTLLHMSSGTLTLDGNTAQINLIGGQNNGYLMQVSTTTTWVDVAVSSNGHIVTNGPKPTISSCGTTPNGSVVGNDNEGTITAGGGSVTACTLTFANSWGSTPTCIISDNSTAVTGDISSLSATAFTVSFSVSLGGGSIYYHCGCSGASCL